MINDVEMETCLFGEGEAIQEALDLFNSTQQHYHSIVLVVLIDKDNVNRNSI